METELLYALASLGTILIVALIRRYLGHWIPTPLRHLITYLIFILLKKGTRGKATPVSQPEPDEDPDYE